MTIPQRLFLTLGISLLITVIVGLSGVYSIYYNAGVTQDLMDKGVSFLSTVEKLKIEALQHRRYEKDFFLNIGKAENQKKYIQRFKTVSQKTQARLAHLMELNVQDFDKDNKLKAHIANAASAYDTYRTNFTELTKKVLATPQITPQEANTLMTPFKDEIYAFENGVDAIQAMARTHLDQMLTQSSIITARLKKAIFFCLGIGIVFTCLLNYFVTRTLSASLKKVIGGLSGVSDQLVTTSTQVSKASQSMADGTSDQAASIEETSSTMEEMSSKIKTNSDHAVHADGLMRETRQVVSQAGKSMGDLTQSMEAITHASNEASNIIKTIDEIAFQTNLLALNAAVEAARAGEAGASFAVVADEVRNLALRAAQAAKDTSQLIEETLTKVDDGATIVSATNSAFNKVEEKSKTVGELITQISEASTEQSNGINMVNQAISAMDQVVQASAATAEESAATAHELGTHAEQLRVHMLGLNRLLTHDTHQPELEAPKKETQDALPVLRDERPQIEEETEFKNF